MANRGTTACGTTIVGGLEMSGKKKIDEGVWWTVGVDCGEERHRFVLPSLPTCMRHGDPVELV
jgi:hypothetical protein